MQGPEIPPADFFRLLRSDVSIYCLPSLTLHNINYVFRGDIVDDKTQWTQLNDVLPALMTLRELHFEMLPRDGRFSFCEVMAGFHANGSICSTSVTCPLNENYCHLSDRESRFLKAYSRRNKQLPKVLSNMPWSTSKPSEIAKRKKNTNARLFPLLIQAAKQVKLSRESAVFSRLVESGQGIGPSQESLTRSLSAGSR